MEPTAPKATPAPGGALRRLLTQSGIYALGNAAIKAGGFVLLLLYLDPDLLSQTEYGRLVLLETTANLAVVLAGLGLAQGLLKYATDPAHAEDRGSLAFTSLVAAALLGVVLCGLIAVAATPLAAWLLDDAGRAGLVRLLGVYAGLKVVGAVPYMALRVEERAGWYVLGLLVEFAALVGGVWYFLAVRGLGLEGVLYGFVLSSGAAVLLLGGALLARAPFQFRPRLIRRLLVFGAPLVFANLANVFLNTGDRFVLDAFEGADAVAVYGLAQKFGSLINMLFVQSFSLAFGVLGLKALGSLDGSEGRVPDGGVGNLHRRTFRHFAVLTGWGVLGVALLTYDVTLLVSPNPAYLDADPLILPIALGFMAYGIYYIMMNVLYATGQTGRIAVNVLGIAGLNLVLNLALVPFIGAMGAALATLGSYAALAGITARQAQRVVRIALPWRALVTVILLIVGLWMLAQPSLGWDGGARLGARLGLIALYPPLVLATGVYTWAEVRSVIASVRRVLG